MLIARTVEEESCSDEGVVWWKEFRVRSLTRDESHKLSSSSIYWKWVIETRYLCRLPDGRTVAKFEQGHLEDAIVNPGDPDDAWHVWEFDDTIDGVIWKMLGDTSFLEAESVSDVHRRLVVEHRIIREAEKDLQNAKEQWDSAKKAIEDFKTKEERKFNNRHGGKNAEALEKIRLLTVKRLTPQLTELREEAYEAEKTYLSREERLKKLPGYVRR